jgi:hypothetical protein
MTVTDQIRSLALSHSISFWNFAQQEVENSATVDVTMSTYLSAYAKSRIAEGIFIILCTGSSYQLLSTYCSFDYALIFIVVGQTLVVVHLQPVSFTVNWVYFVTN